MIVAANLSGQPELWKCERLPSLCYTLLLTREASVTKRRQAVALQIRVPAC
jgi:hypothetical protein